MGFVDSSSSTVVAILTRKGRELLAANNGSFRITKFAMGDDEINYQLYNAATDNDDDILNLPVLEPSSNEQTALKYRLVTLTQGSISVAFLTAIPSTLTLSTGDAISGIIPVQGIVVVTTQNGFDYSGYLATSLDSRIAYPETSDIAALTQVQGSLPYTSGSVLIKAGTFPGSTVINIVGKDTGAVISVPVTTTRTTNSTL